MVRTKKRGQGRHPTPINRPESPLQDPVRPDRSPLPVTPEKRREPDLRREPDFRPVRISAKGPRSPSKSMTKSEIAAYMASKFDLTQWQSIGILDELATLAARQAKNGFVLPGVGKLVAERLEPRMSRHPQSGEARRIPATTVLKFHVAKAMTKMVLR
jgi:DNA-binding protein HU-beta